MATSTASDLWEVPAANGASSRPLVPDDRSLASFKARVEATIELGKNKSKANRVKKNEERIAKQQDVAKMLKRGQRYLGLRARSSSAELHALFLLQLDHSSPSILPPDWDANHPSPHAFEHEPIIISIDIEAYEKPPRPITEIGISTLDTRDLIGVAPGNNCEAWFALVRTRHFRIAEHAHLRNGDFVAGCPDKYEFGKSEFIAQRDAPSKIAECFRPPYSCDVAPSTREVRSAKLEAGTPVKSQDRKTAPSEQPERRRVILLGHDVGQDISYLRSMGYNPLNLDNLLELLDTASMFRAMAREPSPRSLTHILYTFGIVGWNLHNAGNDAAYTMHAFLGIALRSALDDRREAIEANAPKNSSVDEDTIKTQTLKEEREEAVRVKAEQAAREAAERVHELAQGWTDGPGERDNDGGVAVPPTLTDVPAPSDVTSAGRGGRGGRGGSGLRGGRGTDGHGGNSGGNRGGGSNGTGMNRGSSWW
ncbi:hypothetical protein LTR04_005616 [Oleoguttula sp. CCFEE 6159]|nr:hypothetical protein LTR04_005616 [Oleoguttula sp. CCFEE 6159]